MRIASITPSLAAMGGGILAAGIVLLAGACGSDEPQAVSDAGNRSDASIADGAKRAAETGAAPTDAARPEDSAVDAAPDAPVDTRPHTRRLLCINGAGVDGAGGRGTGGNPAFEQLCGTLGPGLIKDCGTGTCYATFGFEALSNPSRDALLAVLDTDKNGQITAADAPVDLVVIGYSWGGTNVRDLAAWMENDSRFDADRRGVSLMIALDPYRPGATMDIPPNVDRFVEYRHSVAPAADCSLITLAGVTISGPYLGIIPRCKASTVCTDYDYTLGGKTFYPDAFAPGKGYLGANVDHCALVDVAASAVPPFLAGTAFSPLPPTVPVGPY